MARSTLDFAQQNTERAVQATNPLLTVYWRWPGMPLVVLTGNVRHLRAVDSGR